MGKFVYFTSAEKRQANEVDLPSFLLDRGEKLIMAGRDYRLASDHSITVRGPMWYDHAARKGGRAISFVQQFYDKTYPEAVTMLLGRDGQGIIPIVKKEPESREPKPFALPEAYLNMRRLYAYLTTHRRIDRDVVTEFVREKLLYEDTLHHNCVFVGVDENGEARHAHLRSTNSQGKVFRINVEGSEAKHSFHKDGTDCSLYVFEAPIDLLSHITLYPAGWLEHSYVACCGTSVQPVLERLRQNPKLNMVYLCLDNDEAGEDACENMMEVLEEMDMLDKCTCAIGVGCCGLGMGYFTYDYLLAAHGRACAVATGAKRSNPETLVFTYQGFKYVGVAGKQISQGMEIPMMYMYGIMPVCGIICAICVVIKIITLYKADISYFAPKNQALSRDDA